MTIKASLYPRPTPPHLYLAGRVHDLDGRDLPVHLEVVLAVAVLDGGVVALQELVVYQAEGQAGLAHAAPAEDHHLAGQLTTCSLSELRFSCINTKKKPSFIVDVLSSTFFLMSILT